MAAGSTAEGDDEVVGHGFLRDMNAQSSRAHEFDRRLRWSRLAQQLRAGTPPEPTPEPVDEDVIDLRPRPAELPAPRPSS